VDVNGPNAEWKYDKRPKLSHHLNDVLYWHFPDAFPLEAAQEEQDANKMKGGTDEIIEASSNMEQRQQQKERLMMMTIIIVMTTMMKKFTKKMMLPFSKKLLRIKRNTFLN
jgi:hypothetical protein